MVVSGQVSLSNIRRNKPRWWSESMVILTAGLTLRWESFSNQNSAMTLLQSSVVSAIFVYLNFLCVRS